MLYRMAIPYEEMQMLFAVEQALIDDRNLPDIDSIIINGSCSCQNLQHLVNILSETIPHPIVRYTHS